MTQMIVRPPQFWANPFGNPAEDYNVYVGVPNYSPRQEQYQLDITDGVDGPIVSNPFKVNKGLAKNANGEIITPVINQQEYSLFFESPSGGGIEISKFIGDGLSSNGGGSGGGIPDLTINNLDQALQTDLSDYNFVFIKSESSGWEGSENGPSVVSFYYRDGTTGAASSGDENKFFDLSGNGWSLANSVTEKALTADVANLNYIVNEFKIDRNISNGETFEHTSVDGGTYELSYEASAFLQIGGSASCEVKGLVSSGTATGRFKGTMGVGGFTQVGGANSTANLRPFLDGNTISDVGITGSAPGPTVGSFGSAIITASAGANFGLSFILSTSAGPSAASAWIKRIK